MKKIFLFIPVILISFIITAQTSKDKQAVKNVVIAFQDGFNNGSLNNAPSFTTSDWEHINPLGGIKKGRDSVLKNIRDVHQTFLKGVTMRIESMDIRFLTAHVAIADVIHQVDSYTTPDGVKHENERHIKTYVIVKKQRKWLLAQDHNTIIQSTNDH